MGLRQEEFTGLLGISQFRLAQAMGDQRYDRSAPLL